MLPSDDRSSSASSIAEHGSCNPEGRGCVLEAVLRKAASWFSQCADCFPKGCKCAEQLTDNAETEAVVQSSQAAELLTGRQNANLVPVTGASGQFGPVRLAVLALLPWPNRCAEYCTLTEQLQGSVDKIDQDVKRTVLDFDRALLGETLDEMSSCQKRCSAKVPHNVPQYGAL